MVKKSQKARKQQGPIVSGEIIRPDVLLEQVLSTAPASGSGSAHSQAPGAAKLFTQLPISAFTLEGLKQNKFKRMTAIQRAAIPHGLCGRDILGAARTGQGKTLAFLVPVFERLYHDYVTPESGLVALIISPTRELALQIFEVIRSVGKYHQNLSAGLVIGGKDYDDEAPHIARMNVLVGTPGRILHHMDNTPTFNTDNLKMLVLDEADRCLDMGFKATLDAILSNLPTDRQTMLFSATQTKKVSTLARLALKDPEYVAVHEESRVTPPKLSQSYIICSAAQKIDLLYSFLLSHTSDKVLVFVASRKQVRFLYQIMGQISTRISSSTLFQLHSGMSQAQRLASYNTFLEASHGLMFATDLAGRGLDFPSVSWVIQFDCPDTVETYIHRVGRTARFTATGRALMFLLESEKPMIDLCKARGIELQKVKPNPAHLHAGTADRIRSLLAQSQDLKYCAQAAFVSYCRSVHLASDKNVFSLDKLPLNELALSMGLSGTPKIKLKGESGKSKHDLKNLPRNLAPKTSAVQPQDKLQKLLSKKGNDILHRLRDDSDEDEGVEFVKVTEADPGHSDDERLPSGPVPVSKQSVQQYAEKIKSDLAKADQTVDKSAEKRRIRQLHQDEKRKLKRRRTDDEPRTAVLGGATDSDSSECPDLVSSDDDGDDDDDDIEARARAILQRNS